MKRLGVSALIGVIVMFGMIGELDLTVAAALGIGVLAAIATAIVTAVHDRSKRREDGAATEAG